MKLYLRILLLLLCPLLLTACGAGSANQQTEYYDIRVEETEIFDSQEPGWYYGFQFYGEDMIQIMLEYITQGSRVWMLNTDGSREQLLSDYSYFIGSWFLTSQGQSILFKNSYVYGTAIYVLSPEGKTLFSFEDVSGRSVCETADGKIYLLAEENGNTFLAELKLSTGTLRKLEGLSLNLAQQLGLNVVPLQCLGLGPEGLMLMDGSGVWKITEEGNRAEKELVLSFDSTSYTDMNSDPATNVNFSLRYPAGFRMLEDGSVELLWRYQDSGQGLLQTLRYEKTEKNILRLRCTQPSVWMVECITAFNRTSENYQIVLEQCTSSSQEYEDFCQRTDMEIAAGKGADLIFGAVSSNFSALLEKGALADLTPCLEQYGLSEEDYFPIALAKSEDADTIYGVMPELVPACLWISREVLNQNKEITIETVVDALYRYPEKGSFQGFVQEDILPFFLQGSENFWGMVDYKKGTCDFRTELFEKILDIARRYGSQSYMDSPAVLGFRSTFPLGFFDSEEELLGQGKIPLGYLFDDGSYPMAHLGKLLAVNAVSANKEGCFEFIAFLLQEENQRKMVASNSAPGSASRTVFAEGQTHALEWSGKMEPITATLSWTYGICTPEEAAEQLEIIENSRYLPLGTGDILGIIRDEAQDYLDGVKPMEVIIENINNRVQLYLNER